MPSLRPAVTSLAESPTIADAPRSMSGQRSLAWRKRPISGFRQEQSPI